MFSLVAYGLCVKCEPKSALQIQKSRISAPTTNVFDFEQPPERVGACPSDVGATATPDGTGDGPRPTGMSDMELIERVPDARVQQRVQQVGDDRRDQVHDADHEHAGLEHREVLALRGGEDQVADARVVEQRLDDRQPADQVARPASPRP